MSPGQGARVARAAVAAVLLAAVGLLAWRAFGVRPGGRFPILDDVPIGVRSPRSPANKVSPRLREQLAQPRVRSGAESLRLVVDLRSQVDLLNFSNRLDKRGVGRDRAARRAAVLEALRLAADHSQRGLREALERMQAAGRIERYDPFRIVGRVAVIARDPTVVDELAARDDVDGVLEARPPLQPTVRVAAPKPGTGPDSSPATDAAAPAVGIPEVEEGPVDPISWAIEAVHAPQAWERGLDGRGVVVGLLDTGVRGDHEQLHDNWRGSVDPSRRASSWYHPLRPDATEPFDSAMHGTSVLSAAVGLNRPLRDGRPARVGVAPGATWVAAAAYVEDSYDRILATAAADWMLFEAQPDVLIHTFTYGKDAEDPLGMEMFSAFRAAETVCVFAAGNHGPTAGRNFPPSNYAGLYPSAMAPLSVGSTNAAGEVSVFSAQGPSAANFTGLFPQLVAPGENLTLAFPLAPDALIRQLGTSFSAGYVAGAAAILLQAEPRLRPNEVEFSLKKGARAIGGGANNLAGWGLVDITASLDLVERDLRPALDRESKP